MAGKPVMIVLYDTDAVETRCSDGSRLELSPCGATMIYQPPQRKGEHPRHGMSSRVHKRTCFVTSDHKQLVLQTLDFRNRFAQRPYLCEELLNKEDVLTLYASVDSIRWPDSVTNTTVEILADGSKKITSLDDFASLVVSPHGQDFSISYLSQISFDDKGKNSSMQFLQSSNVSYCLSRNKTQSSSNSNLGDGKSCSDKTNEAIVQPFQLMTLENQQSSTSSHSVNTAQTFPGNINNIETAANSGNQNECATNFDRGIADDGNKSSSSSSSELDKTLIGETTPRLQEKRLQNCNVHRIVPTSNAGDRCMDEGTVYPASNGPNSKHDETGSIIIGSPVAHDISSISRSSTPDGLRTTIDSDATLIHDHNETDTLQGRRMLYNHQRHSSPTHCSSPLDDLHHLSFEARQCNQVNTPPSLDGSYLEYHRHSPVGGEGTVDVHNSQHNKLKPSDERNTNNHGNNQFDLKFNAQSQMMEPAKNDVRKVSSHLFHNEVPAALDPLVTEMQNGSVAVSGHGRTGTEINNSNGDVPTNARFSSQLSGNRGLLNDVNQKFQTVSGVSETNVYSNTEPTSAHHDSHSKSSLHSPRMLSSVIESDAEEESACRTKYVWVTAHASRNCCPKEWVHPLTMVLKADDEKKPKGTKEKQKSSPIPKPLPLICPFQHKHRISHRNSSDDLSTASNGGKNVEDSFTSRIGEFQQGRLKVVLSEGIIYRLTSCNKMTVVEVYPGDGTVLVSEGVKAVFFTHYVPRTNILEERTYSLKSLPPGCAKGRHSIERMMKTANRLVQICLNWDKRCGKGKPPCWQKEVVAVVQPLSSSLLEECFVDGLGRFSAFTNGRVRILFDDRTALDTVADFKPRLGNVTEMHRNVLFQNEAGATTARLLVTSGNYVTVEINNPGPYARYTSAAREWIAWVNASHAERQEFYKQENQPIVMQQAAEHELRKIFCFNYILEHTTAALSTQTKQDGEPQPQGDGSASTLSVNTTAEDNHYHLYHQNNDNHHVKSPTKASNLPYHHHYHQTTAPPQHHISSSHTLTHHHHHPSSSSSSTSNPQPPSSLHQNHHHHHNNNNYTYNPPRPNHTPSNSTTPSTSIPKTYNPITTATNRTNTQQTNPMPFYNPTFSKSNTNTQHTPFSSYTRHTPNTLNHEDRCVQTSMGFQSVRSALSRTSSLINDIEMFLEDTKT